MEKLIVTRLSVVGGKKNDESFKALERNIKKDYHIQKHIGKNDANTQNDNDKNIAKQDKNSKNDGKNQKNGHKNAKNRDTNIKSDKNIKAIGKNANKHDKNVQKIDKNAKKVGENISKVGNNKKNFKKTSQKRPVFVGILLKQKFPLLISTIFFLLALALSFVVFSKNSFYDFIARPKLLQHSSAMLLIVSIFVSVSYVVHIFSSLYAQKQTCQSTDTAKKTALSSALTSSTTKNLKSKSQSNLLANSSATQNSTSNLSKGSTQNSTQSAKQNEMQNWICQNQLKTFKEHKKLNVLFKNASLQNSKKQKSRGLATRDDMLNFCWQIVLTLSILLSFNCKILFACVFFCFLLCFAVLSEIFKSKTTTQKLLLSVLLMVAFCQLLSFYYIFLLN